MMSSTDFYAVLDVDPSATQDEIRSRYYRQVRRHPPEKDEEGFQRVQQAYDVLGNPKTRAEYDEQRKSDPETQRLVGDGRELLEEGDPGAVTPMKRALMRQPESLYIRDLFVQALMLGEEYDDAEKQVRVLIAAAPENPVYYMRLGGILRAGDREEEAEEPFRKALELDRETPQPVLRLAYLLSYLDRAEEAVRLLRRAIVRDGRVDFEDFLFFQALCRYFVNSGDLENVNQIHVEIRKILPPDSETRSFVAWFYYVDAMQLADMGNFDAAIPMIEEAKGIDDSLPQLGETHARIQQSKAALDDAMKLKDDSRVRPELSQAVCLFAVSVILGGDESTEKAYEEASRYLSASIVAMNSGLREEVNYIRRTYPQVSQRTSGFLTQVEQRASGCVKSRVRLECPICGTVAFAVLPGLEEYDEMCRRRAWDPAFALERDSGLDSEGLLRSLTYECSDCGKKFDGNSQSTFSVAVRTTPGGQQFVGLAWMMGFVMVLGVLASIFDFISGLFK